MFMQFACLSVNNKRKAKQKRKINFISPKQDRNNMCFHIPGFLFTWLSHALHCTKLFLYFTMMFNNYHFHIKGPFFSDRLLFPSQLQNHQCTD